MNGYVTIIYPKSASAEMMPYSILHTKRGAKSGVGKRSGMPANSREQPWRSAPRVDQGPATFAATGTSVVNIGTK